jgi:Rrf2 family iron-sulfur cluster assembly transcriptional regulator
MRLTTRGRYAVTAMLDLALSGRNGPVTVAHISARQKISPQYFEQLFARLRNHRLVESVRGPGGGFCLSRLPDDISVAEIIRAVDEPIDATRCHGNLNCHDGKRCMTHELWDDLNGVISGYLASVSLARLIARQASRNADVQPLKLAQRQAYGSTAFMKDSKRS